MSGYYILKNKKAVQVNNLTEWATQFGKQNKRVAKDTINGVDISTMFLGLDHQYSKGKPLLFETMVFGGELDQEQERYSTWEEAVAGHRRMVIKVKGV